MGIKQDGGVHIDGKPAAVFSYRQVLFEPMIVFPGDHFADIVLQHPVVRRVDEIERRFPDEFILLFESIAVHVRQFIGHQLQLSLERYHPDAVGRGRYDGFQLPGALLERLFRPLAFGDVAFDKQNAGRFPVESSRTVEFTSI